MTDRKKITAETYEHAAEGYAERFMPMTLYNDLYHRFCNHIFTPSPQILEIGCGPGNVIQHIQKHLPTARIIGTDLSTSMIAIAQQQFPTVDFRVLDARDVSSLDQHFDAVITSFILPYLDYDECASLIRDIHTLLHHDGIVYLSTMEGTKSRSGYERTSFAGDREVYIHYYTRDFLEQLFEEEGFDVLSLDYKDYEEANGSITRDMIYMLRKRA